MELVGVLRELARRRLLVAIGILLAMAAGLVVAYRVSPGVPPKFESRQYGVGVSTASVLIDSPNSQVVDLGLQESVVDVAVLAARARLLARLMATTGLKDRIAERAGIPPLSLVGVPPAGDDGAPTAAPSGAPVRPDGSDEYTMSLVVAEALPIIIAEIRAPTPASAARVSTAAVTELGVFVQQAAVTAKVPDTRQLVARPLGKATSATIQEGTSPATGVLAFCAVLLLWCLGILGAISFTRGWQQAAASEQRGVEDDREGDSVDRDPAGEPGAPGPATDAEPDGLGVDGLPTADVEPPAAVRGGDGTDSAVYRPSRRRVWPVRERFSRPL